MKISYNWIKEMLPLDWEAHKTAALLTDLGLEVEGVEEFSSVRGGLKGVVVGKVLECVQHPNADRLKLTQVDIGTDESVQIVCGAPNVASGQTVPVATIGTELYDGEGNPWTIKKGKIRGEYSHGMICAEDELGLGESHEGILVLEEKWKAGTPLNEVFPVEQDTVFEIGLTPNRADAMSHYGVARDLRAGLALNNVEFSFTPPSVSGFSVDSPTHPVEIRVEDPAGSPRYAGVTLTGLQVGPSPKWLQNRLKAIGLNPINNVVDATNYVLHELGQPLHAFDLDKVKDRTIVVQRLGENTPFTTLDGVERKLSKEDLMICDAEKPMCIAGVFGGTFSGVSGETTSIFLESAYFDPVSVRKTAKRHGLNTDASFRFERGIDQEQVVYGLKRAALLIKEIAGGTISSSLMDLEDKPAESRSVFLQYEKLDQLIGSTIDREIIKKILPLLDIQIQGENAKGLDLTVPFYRVDVTREVDVIEEILRVYGYNTVEIPSKMNFSVASSSWSEPHLLESEVSTFLSARGFNEILTNSLEPLEMESYRLAQGEEVQLLNPLSSDLGRMRTEAVVSALPVIRHNLNRQQDHIALFEWGKTYHKVGRDSKQESYQEEKYLGMWMTEKEALAHWKTAGHRSDFFSLKGNFEGLLNRLGISFGAVEELENSPLLSHGLQWKIGDRVLAVLGSINKDLCKHFDIKGEVYFAQLNWGLSLELLQNREPIQYSPVPKFPVVRRDLALLVEQGVRFSQIEEQALKAENRLLKSVGLFDVYEGKELPKGKKSYAIQLLLQDENKTLTDKQIDKMVQKITQRLQKELQAELR
jgi:phenylalanyl-tRNA synthetase beta chain